MRVSRLMMAVVFVSVAACGGKVPGGKGMPGGDKIPGGDKVPGGMGGESGMVDPNSCGNYAGTEAGARLKAFLEAVVELQARSKETVDIVSDSCKTMGKELGMADADLSGEPKELCAKVWNAYNENMKVAVKGKAAFKITYKPAVCQVDVNAEADIAAKCEGKA